MPYKVGKKPDIKYWYRKKDERKIQISLQLPDPNLTGRKYGPLDFTRKTKYSDKNPLLYKVDQERKCVKKMNKKSWIEEFSKLHECKLIKK